MARQLTVRGTRWWVAALLGGLVLVMAAVAIGAFVTARSGRDSSSPPAATSGPRQVAPLVTPTPRLVPDRRDVVYTDPAGTRSSYHLFTSAATVGSTRAPVGLVVYLDGDGMYGHRHPSDPWALGGPQGVVAQAAARGYAVLSIATPSRDGTFWTRGSVNADHVASLIDVVRAELGVRITWLVGYSGGAQLITQFLLPRHSELFAPGGGAVIAGGGGPPAGTPRIDPALRRGFVAQWYTGAADDGTTSEDGYDAADDARQGSAWYRRQGLQVTHSEPAGVDHEDLGGRFGTLLGQQLDQHRRGAQAPTS